MPFEVTPHAFSGPAGRLEIREDDEVSRKLAMLMVGECEDTDPSAAARQFGFSRQRYFQLRAGFLERGAEALINRPRGPKTNYRRTREVVCQAIRHRFLDPEATVEVIVQKLRQCGFSISVRSVDRIFEEYGLQKKTLQVSP